MFKLHDISIKNKLVLMQVFTSVLVLSIVFAVFVITDISSYKERKVNSVVSLAQVIGSNCVSTLQFQDDAAAKQILSELYTIDPEIVRADILDKKGRVFASYSKPGTYNLSISSILDGKESVFSGRHLFVNKPIINNKEIIGSVFLEVELSELEEIKQSKYEITTLLLLMAIGFSFLIAMAIQSYISKRLLGLVTTMKEVSKTGDYDNPIQDEGKDEISILIKVFNNLMLEIKESQQRKNEFIGIASHELKTPLTSIKGYMQLLDRIEDKQPHKLYVQKTLENIQKLESLIKDLLDVSKIQSGQLKLNIQEFNIDNLLDEAINSIQMVSGTHEIIKHNNLPGETITADRQRIEQVLINLLSNAIKYSPGENKVIVYSQKTNNELIIKIRDFGIGVPKEEQANIFERFYRTKDMSNYVSGFGLGLYICKNIINRHKGRIWVESEEKGSSFSFSLPLTTRL